MNGILARAADLARIRLATATAIVAALLFGAPSLAYPLASDQGIFFYVAREWFWRGAIPYRDTFDHKPPGIYVVYGLALWLFGEAPWGIRVLELLCVPLVGWLASRVELPGVPNKRYTATLIWLSSVLYFGFLNFVDTAQCEIWCVLFALAAACAANRPGARWATLSGIFLSLGMLMKPTAALFALPVAVLLRDGRRTARLGAWTLGIAGPWMVTLTYFACKSSLGAAIDIVVKANAYYLAHDHIGAEDVIARLIGLVRHYMPFSVVLAYGLLALGYGGAPPVIARSRHLIVWLAAGMLASVVQMKFYINHFTLLLGPSLLTARAVMTELTGWLSARGVTERRASAFFIVNAALLLVLSWSGEHVWFGAARDALLATTGLMPREKLRARWGRNEVGFDLKENERVAEWIQEHTSTADSVCIRGAEAEIYALAGRRCASPFFWTTWLTAPSRAYRRSDYLAKDRSALERERPRFIVARREARVGDVDHPSFAAELGYTPTTEIGRYVVLEDAHSRASP